MDESSVNVHDFERIQVPETAIKQLPPKIHERNIAVKTCPPIWTSVIATLITLFTDSTVKPAQCNDNARAAIRACFHDCGTWNTSLGSKYGCDGSLILAREAFTQADDNALQNISNTLTAVRAQYPSIGMADLIVVASSVAIRVCPGGPTVTTYIGRNDSSILNPAGLLPGVNDTATSLITLFKNKGFSTNDLAALIGAHSTARAFAQPNIQFGAPQDSTPGAWDIEYYKQVASPPAGVYSFLADRNLAADKTVGSPMAGFAGNKTSWNGAFASAMGRLTLLGVEGGSSLLVDCTGFLP
ncbi:heme peroxidase [Mollisia scopiformis]|uniref:Peroxidase n=1 Tax=Mollisia scopiformis TaxID=149040 RepID=A0A194X7M1_MOLSC|nr:heme peroxidase [Mollisia scopiformis]KUJ16166.1 heme peroxidase [Mollisia scopiformis]